MCVGLKKQQINFAKPAIQENKSNSSKTPVEKEEMQEDETD